jgi:hypothetical protein
MSKVIKDREDFINENYYEASNTAVPGAGVGPGLFPGAAANSRNLHEKDVPQTGANGVVSDPDYRDPAEYTHAKYAEGRPQLGDMVEDVNPDCPKYKSFGKVFAIQDGHVEYICANSECDGCVLGEVARVPMQNVKVLKKHQMNQ